MNEVFPCVNCDPVTHHSRARSQEILQHFYSEHPEKIKENPCNLSCNINETTMDLYLVSCFDSFFCVSSKYSALNKMFFHNVQLLNDVTTKYKFTLEIIGVNGTLTKTNTIKPYHLSNFSDDISVNTGLSAIQNVRGMMEDIQFVITISPIVKENTFNDIEKMNSTKLNNENNLYSKSSNYYGWKSSSSDSGTLNSQNNVNEYFTTTTEKCSYKEITNTQVDNVSKTSTNLLEQYLKQTNKNSNEQKIDNWQNKSYPSTSKQENAELEKCKVENESSGSKEKRKTKEDKHSVGSSSREISRQEKKIMKLETKFQQFLHKTEEKEQKKNHKMEVKLQKKLDKIKVKEERIKGKLEKRNDSDNDSDTE